MNCVICHEGPIEDLDGTLIECTERGFAHLKCAKLAAVQREVSMSPKIRRAVIECPQGHTRASALYDPTRATEAEAEKRLRESFAETCETHSCGVCHSKETSYRNTETEFGLDQLAEACIAEQNRVMEQIAKLVAQMLEQRMNQADRHSRN